MNTTHIQKTGRFLSVILKALSITMFIWSAVPPAHGGEFRSFKPIAGPDQIVATWVGPSESYRNSPDIQQILKQARARVPDLARQALSAIFDGWGSGTVEKYLSQGFYDKNRFLDIMSAEVPRDARIRILAVESIHPLEETYTVNSGASLELNVQTRLSAVVRTQIEFDDHAKGFRRIEGKNEFILRLSQSIPLTSNEGR